MLDSQLTDDFRFSRTYKVDIEDFVKYYRRDPGFKSFAKKHNFHKESDLYSAIVDNVLFNESLVQWWKDCITGEDRVRVVVEAALLEDAYLTTDEIAALMDIMINARTQRDMYSDLESYAEERFIERYKRETGLDYVETESIINIYAD